MARHSKRLEVTLARLNCQWKNWKFLVTVVVSWAFFRIHLKLLPVAFIARYLPSLGPTDRLQLLGAWALLAFKGDTLYEWRCFHLMTIRVPFHSDLIPMLPLLNVDIPTSRSSASINSDALSSRPPTYTSSVTGTPTYLSPHESAHDLATRVGTWNGTLSNTSSPVSWDIDTRDTSLAHIPSGSRFSMEAPTSPMSPMSPGSPTDRYRKPHSHFSEAFRINVLDGSLLPYIHG